MNQAINTQFAFTFPDNPHFPSVSSTWMHRNGNSYRVVAITNTSKPSSNVGDERYPATIVYLNVSNGTLWSRRADDWHRSFTPTTL